jgi:hypothetical protein
MCFSATANFAGSAILGTIGIATLKEVKDKREVLFAALPVLFALHQFTEGFVWLGLDHRLSSMVAHDAGAAFVLYAQGLLPFLIPLSIFLIEPTPHRRRLMLGFLILGALLTLYILWGLTAYPLQVYLQHHSIVYVNAATTTMVIAVLYVVATCGALFFSGFRAVVLLGFVNVAGLVVVMLLRLYAFTSLWCAYAALVSVIIYFFFRKRRQTSPI